MSTRLDRLIEENDRALARMIDIRERVIRELIRSEQKLAFLRKTRKHYQRLTAKREAEAAGSHRATAEPAPEIDAANQVPTQSNHIAVAVKDDGIPDYLRRDQIAREKIKSEIAAAKKTKADRAAKKRAIKRDMVKADLTGLTRRMPLQGKDALEAIYAPSLPDRFKR